MNSKSFQLNKEASKAKETQHKKKRHAKNNAGQKSGTLNEKKGGKTYGKFSDNEDDREKSSVSKVSPQPNCRFADIDNNQEEHRVTAFEDLLNIPVSTSSFVFKHEKDWSCNTSKYSDYFSVDIDRLMKIFMCIPFNEYVEIDDKYFNTDELTCINVLAEQAKKTYLQELEESKKSERPTIFMKKTDDNNHKTKCEDSDKKGGESVDDNIEDDLDFLLTLKEPVNVLPVAISSKALRVNEDITPGKVSPRAPKSIDLEKWLDSVLDD